MGSVGPFVVMEIAALIIGAVCLGIMSTMSKGFGKELFRILAIVLIVGGSYGALHIASGIWGYS